MILHANQRGTSLHAIWHWFVGGVVERTSFLGRPFPFLVRSVVFGGNENLKKSWHYDDIVWE